MKNTPHTELAMRIGMIITELYPGGAESCFVNLAIYLHEQGHVVSVWELWPPPPIGKRQLYDQLAQHKIPIESGGATRAWDFPKLTQWLNGELRKFKPDVVQAFLFHANLAAAIASRREAWKLFGGARVRQPETLRQLAQRWAARRMEKLICVSNSVKSHCEKQEHIPSDKLVVIPNGIRLADPFPGERNLVDLRQSGIPAGTPILLFIGRLENQKGILPLLQRADAILEGLPQHQLVILGDGRLRSQLNQTRNTSKYPERIHLLGWQPNALHWIDRCELLLLPALYEGMPNVVLQCMSRGRPVVAFDVDGIRELLGEDWLGNQQIIPAGDFAHFTTAIQKFASDSSLRAQCGEHNLARIQGSFRLEQQLAKYAELYKHQLTLIT